MFKSDNGGKLEEFNKLVSLIENSVYREEAYFYYKRLSKIYDNLNLDVKGKQVLCIRLNHLLTFISKKPSKRKLVETSKIEVKEAKIRELNQKENIMELVTRFNSLIKVIEKGLRKQKEDVLDQYKVLSQIYSLINKSSISDSGKEVLYSKFVSLGLKLEKVSSLIEEKKKQKEENEVIKEQEKVVKELLKGFNFLIKRIKRNLKKGMEHDAMEYYKKLYAVYASIDSYDIVTDEMKEELHSKVRFVGVKLKERVKLMEERSTKIKTQELPPPFIEGVNLKHGVSFVVLALLVILSGFFLINDELTNEAAIGLVVSDVVINESICEGVNCNYDSMNGNTNLNNIDIDDDKINESGEIKKQIKESE
jgi:DNA-binding ferritin-like protein|tara:strand:+ start:537 stop:1631 length:1095 start_codon:yes stop_codon:yes gene_type:complete